MKERNIDKFMKWLERATPGVFQIATIAGVILFLAGIIVGGWTAASNMINTPIGQDAHFWSVGTVIGILMMVAGFILGCAGFGAKEYVVTNDDAPYIDWAQKVLKWTTIVFVCTILIWLIFGLGLDVGYDSVFNNL